MHEETMKLMLPSSLLMFLCQISIKYELLLISKSGSASSGTTS